MQIPAINTQSVSSGVIRIIVRIKRLARMEDGEVSGLAVRTRNRELTKCRTRYAGNSRVVTQCPGRTTTGWQRDQFRATDGRRGQMVQSFCCLSLTQYFPSLQLSKIPHSHKTLFQSKVNPF